MKPETIKLLRELEAQIKSDCDLCFKGYYWHTLKHFELDCIAPDAWEFVDTMRNALPELLDDLEKWKALALQFAEIAQYTGCGVYDCRHNTDPLEGHHPSCLKPKAVRLLKENKT